jgi:hypothetical protein
VGQTLDLTMTSVQDISSSEIESYIVTLSPPAAQLFAIFYDKIWKTFVTVDTGPPSGIS